MNETRINTIYKCDFKQQSKALIKIWLVDSPEISAQGESITDCEDELDQVLTDKYEDILPIFEYVRPLPDSEYPNMYRSKQFVVLGSYERGELQNDVNTLFERDICKLCSKALGERNQEILEIYTGKTSADLLHISVNINDIVSEKLVKAFDLKRYFEVRKVIMTNVNERNYFELIPLSNSQKLNSVAVKDEFFMLGRPEFYACTECGTKSTVYLGEKGFNYVVEDKSILSNHDAFQINRNLVVRRSLWDRLHKSDSKLKKISSSQLGVTKSSNIVRSPSYKTIGE